MLTCSYCVSLNHFFNLCFVYQAFYIFSLICFFSLKRKLIYFVDFALRFSLWIQSSDSGSKPPPLDKPVFVRITCTWHCACAFSLESQHSRADPIFAEDCRTPAPGLCNDFPPENADNSPFIPRKLTQTQNDVL